MPDKNYRSFTGPHLGRIDIGDLAPAADPEFSDGGWDDTLKFSGASDGHILAGYVSGGREDCVDLNNGCRGITVDADIFAAHGRHVATVKGGCSSIELRGHVLHHGDTVDVELDNYSDQSNRPCRDIRLALYTLDGSPITWRSWRGCRPVILNPEQAYKCQFCLPAWLGAVIMAGYRAIKWCRRLVVPGSPQPQPAG